MEHDLRPVAREHLADAALVLRVADHGSDRHPRRRSRNSCSIEYSANSESSNSTRRAGREARDLAAQLRADRAARAGDQHGLAVQERVQRASSSCTGSRPSRSSSSMRAQRATR